MKISLVLTSNDRQHELDRFSLTLSRQTFPDEVEVIFVAQGPARFQLPTIPNTTIRVIEKNVGGSISLSKARNIGIREASGEIVGFPDDDCWYEAELLAKVAAYFQDNPSVDCISTNVYDPKNGRSVGAPRPHGVTRSISYWNVFRFGMSAGIFVRAAALKQIGNSFDEKLGVGAEIGSGEETEFLGRILDKGCKIAYAGEIGVYHEARRSYSESIVKMYSYATGYGYVTGSFIRRGHLQVLPYFLTTVARLCAGVSMYLLVQEKRASYVARLQGIVKGCIESRC